MRIKAAACLPCAGGPRARLLGRKLASPPFTGPSRPPAAPRGAGRRSRANASRPPGASSWRSWRVSSPGGSSCWRCGHERRTCCRRSAERLGGVHQSVAGLPICVTALQHIAARPGQPDRDTLRAVVQTLGETTVAAQRYASTLQPRPVERGLRRLRAVAAGIVRNATPSCSGATGRDGKGARSERQEYGPDAVVARRSHKNRVWPPQKVLL